MSVVVGQIVISQFHVEWNIDTLTAYSLLLNPDDIRSNEFYFAGAIWYLEMNVTVKYPSGSFDIHLSLNRTDSGSSENVAYQFFWKTENGRMAATTESTHGFQNGKWRTAFPGCPISTLLQRDRSTPSYVITVICTLKYGEPSALDLTVPEKQKNNWTGTEASTQTEGDVYIGKLQQHFKELLLDGKHSDVVLSVKDREFAVHRGILTARSTVFSAMMEHEMKEKCSGVVSIKDSDPDTFPDFLQYLYTGSLDSLTSEKALHLYVTADKYQVDELKSVCLENIVNNITVENFCDVLSLSLRHYEKKLIAAASAFFVKNSMAVVLTPKWQVFMHENSVAANELFVKLIREKVS